MVTGSRGGGGLIAGWPQAALRGSGSDAVPTHSIDSVPRRIVVRGQEAWAHDEGHAYGTFHTFDGIRLGTDRPRKIHVFLPRDYERSGRRYPVVFMNDGQTAFFPGGPAAKSWGVGETLSRLAAEDRIRPVIVVAIHPHERGWEYTHTSPQGEPAPRETPRTFRLPAYADWVADELKPFIDAAYRTDPDSKATSIVGSSHGGLAAFYMATVRPDCFGNAGALSSSFWYGLDRGGRGGSLADSLLIDRGRGALSDPSRRPRLWIDWGLVRDGGAHNSEIERLATQRGEEMVDLLTTKFGYVARRDLFAFEDAAAGHDEDAWRGRFPGVMETFYPARAF